MVRFDGYSASTEGASAPQLVSLFDPIGSGLKLREGRGFHTFGSRVAVLEGSTEVGSVMWGGKQGARTFIEVKGERTPGVVDRLRSLCEHRATRVDSCADFDAPGAFSRLLRASNAVRKEHDIWSERRGDWTKPEFGRTLYLGAPTSVTRYRLYEKGKQPEYRHLGRSDWVRAEVQVRPAKDAKVTFSHLSPRDVWGASAFTRDLAARILADYVDPHPAGTVWKHTDHDRAILFMCRQYGARLVTMLEDCGTWENVGATLGEIVRELQSKRRSVH